MTLRIGRLFVGMAVILFALWVIVGEQITGVSSDAVLNARLSTVRAPIAGTLDMPRRTLGSAFNADEVFAALTDPLADTVRLNDLRMEQVFATAEIDRLSAFAPDETNSRTDNTGADAEVLANRSPRTDTRIGRNELDVYLVEARQRLAAIDARIAAEENRVALLSSAQIASPTNSLLWQVLAEDGEVVQRGQDIVTLLVCQSSLVTLSVADNIYNRLRVGQIAKFRLDGQSTIYDGTITRLAGASAETIYRNLAVAPSAKHLERYDVALLVPELRTDPDLQFNVGQTGRVFFDTRPLDWVRDILN